MTAPQPAGSYVCSVRDAAQLTRVPVSTLKRWVLRGLLEDHGDGRTLQVDLEAVTELAGTREAHGTQQRLPTAHSVS